MKYYVNDACIGCGLCAGACPNVFQMEGARAVAIPGDVPGEEVASAQEALEGCPVSAIEAEE